jgi:hypothetical protein
MPPRSLADSMRSRKTHRDRLTRKQTRYLRQLREIFEILAFDFENIRDYPTAEERTVQLERILDHVVRGEIITQFTLIDELLSHELAGKILGDRVKNRRRSKRFQAVKNALVESHLSLRHKLTLLRGFVRVPNDVVTYIGRLNKLRNHLAHQFFLKDAPEKLKYSGRNIFSVEGLALFHREQERVFNYLVLR